MAGSAHFNSMSSVLYNLSGSQFVVVCGGNESGDASVFGGGVALEEHNLGIGRKPGFAVICLRSAYGRRTILG